MPFDGNSTSHASTHQPRPPRGHLHLVRPTVLSTLTLCGFAIFPLYFVLCFLPLRSCFPLYSFGILWPTHYVKRSKHQKQTSKEAKTKATTWETNKRQLHLSNSGNKRQERENTCTQKASRHTVDEEEEAKRTWQNDFFKITVMWKWLFAAPKQKPKGKRLKVGILQQLLHL